MSYDLANKLKQFYASAPTNLRSIQVIEISHSQMTKTYYFWREPYSGTVTLDDESVVSVKPLNFNVELTADENNLDQVFKITLCTVDETDEFKTQLDLISVDTAEKISVIYREYLSDDLTTPMITATLTCENVTYNATTATLNAVSPRLNLNRTGETYNYADVPMLRGIR